MAINLRKTVNKDKLKAKFEAEAQGGNNGPSDFLPYFNLKNKDSITVRFLSDANPNNQDTFTYTEEVFNFNGKNMKFDGLSKDCPASKIASDLFAEAKALGEETAEGKEVREKALKYYKKRKYLANAYVVDAPDYFWGTAGLDPDKIEDRVKVISLPKKVYDSIKDTVMDDDFSDVEFYNFGDDVVNFKLTVKKNTGGFNDYSSSKFEIKPKELDIADETVDVIAENLKDLADIFKAHSLAEFNEAIEIEMSGEDDSDSESKQKKVTKKPAQTVAKPSDDEDDDEETVVVSKSKSNSKVSAVSDDDDDEASEAPTNTTDIKSLRSGILNKLRVPSEE
jgi:hypothetical protein